MTKHIYRLATRLQQTLLGAPWPPPPEIRVMVDAWASLQAWHAAGEHVYRIRRDVRMPPIAPDLDLAAAPTVRPAVCYVLDTDQWLIVARHRAHEPIPIRAPERIIGYPAPVLTYCTEVEHGRLASGYVNLTDIPVVSRLRLGAGTSIGLAGATALDGHDISEEMLRLARCLPYYYATAQD